MNGIFNEVREITEACDKLETHHYDMITNFYSLAAAKKINLPNVPIEFFAEFLTISENKRRSISKLSLK